MTRAPTKIMPFEDILVVSQKLDKQWHYPPERHRRLDMTGCIALWMAIVLNACWDVWEKGDLEAYLWLARTAPDMFDTFGMERQPLMRWLRLIEKPPKRGGLQSVINELC